MAPPRLRVIVTRPLAQARPWVDALRAKGIDAVALPLIEIAALDDVQPLCTAWQQLPHKAALQLAKYRSQQKPTERDLPKDAIEVRLAAASITTRSASRGRVHNQRT